MTWEYYIQTNLREYFLRPLLQDKQLLQMLSLLGGQRLGNVLLGRYFGSNLARTIMPLTKDNTFLLKQTLLEEFLKII